MEAEFFDVDPQNGVHITLMAHEVVFIPFAFLSLEPRRPTPQPPESLHKPQYSERRSAAVADGQSSKYQEGGAAAVERSVVVAFVSSSHGHIVSVIQVYVPSTWRAFLFVLPSKVETTLFLPDDFISR